MIKAEMSRVKVVGLADRAHRHDPGGSSGRRGCLRGGGGVAAARRTRRGVSGSDHQPQLRAQGVQDRCGRMALEAQVPIVPLIVWGAHRIWTKDHPEALGRNKIPVTVAVGEPIAPVGSVEEIDDDHACGDDAAADCGAGRLSAARRVRTGCRDGLGGTAPTTGRGHGCSTRRSSPSGPAPGAGRHMTQRCGDAITSRC